MSTIATLPEELVLQIFSYLETAPPSQLKNRLEPSLDLTSNETHHPLKDISQVSHSWRRITLPLLFKHSRLRLDGPARAEWRQCPACGDSPSPSMRVDGHHQALMKSAKTTPNDEPKVDTCPSRSSEFTQNTLEWAARIHHSISDYLTFIQQNELHSQVQSFVLSTDRMVEDSQLRFPHRMAATSDYRYRAAAELWHHLFSVIPTLKRCVIVAPPADMACLTNCAIDLFGDWAFEDMGFHILELGLDDHQSPTLLSTNGGGATQGYYAQMPSSSNDGETTRPATDFPSLSFVPSEYPGIAASSILKIRPWSQLALNEGSFLRAYGTYEYFERGPPSLIYSIKDCLASNRRAWRPHSQSGMDLSALRTFTYTAILPFANHCDFRGLLPYIDELDIKLAPDPTSGILHDKDRVGKAELEDCWQEFFDAYRAITKPFRAFEIRPDGTPKLRKFVCRDVSTPALVDDLDEEFIPLCMPVWAEMKPGVFVRQQSAPPAYLLEGV